MYALETVLRLLLYIKNETLSLCFRTKSHLQDGDIVVGDEVSLELDKYTFSNVMALSVKLGIWEASLNRYVDSIEYITEVILIHC